ncbi:putative Vacuolar protein sorting-associated protein 13A [Hibiscus syriacus]|uniref:Vacuolar protein sorting-associated protein 13A n=1 Tax=Hibiscus syriacus TaxID=106335 RepID=A0A6A2ZU32_HIBSY|nr:uncharacterized protein LOC120140296 [Hibiscus syriacus]KAE8694365.1 putative Vacuolar protein sorting-associated protein 13A [Hibiscus syriacus]
MGSKKRKISLEGYIDFLSSHKQLPLTVDSLHQIFSIHGFKKPKGVKKELSDAVETLDLIDPSRSTLRASISSNAWLTQEELIGDLSCLDWQECRVTAIENLNSSFPEQRSNSIPKAQAKRKGSAGVDLPPKALVLSPPLYFPFNHLEIRIFIDRYVLRLYLTFLKV